MRITAVKPLPDYRLQLRFSDGADGVVDLSSMVGKGVFAAWQRPGVFETVRLNAESGTVCWTVELDGKNTELDLDPDVLYSKATGTALPDADAA